MKRKGAAYRLAGTVHSAAATAQWQRIIANLSESRLSALEALLLAETNTQPSPFAKLCRVLGVSVGFPPREYITRGRRFPL
jgi:hypothetical protein